MKNLAIILTVALGLLAVSCTNNEGGCTDPKAINFESSASIDDGSCIYDEAIRGCTNPNSDNYNPEATEDDGSCIVSGCTDPNAENYDPNATEDDGSCIDQREKFEGTWSVDSDCGFAFPLSNQSEIEIITTSLDRVTIVPLTLAGDEVYAVIDGLSITFPAQTAGGGFIPIDFTGSGMMNADYTEFTVDYTYTSFFGGEETCTATYTKQ